MLKGILVHSVQRFASAADHGRALVIKVSAPRAHSPHPASMVRGQHLTYVGYSDFLAQGRGQSELPGI